MLHAQHPGLRTPDSGLRAQHSGLNTQRLRLRTQDSGLRARHRRPRRRAITLLEMLLAVSLIILTMATLFLFYTISLGATDRAARYTVRTQQARVVLQQMSREIRQACTGASDKAVGLTGRMYSLTLLTSGMVDSALMYSYGLDTRPPMASCDLRQIDYYLAVDPDSPDEAGNPGVLGLVRREQKQLTEEVVDLDNTEVLQQVRMLAPEVQYIRFRYFDGQTWQDVWPGGAGANSLPQAVKIEIGFAPDADMLTNQSKDLLETTDFDLMGNVQDQPPVPGRYSLVVRLPTANNMMASLKAAQQGITNALGGGLTGGSGLGGGLGGSTLH